MKKFTVCGVILGIVLSSFSIHIKSAAAEIGASEASIETHERAERKANELMEEYQRMMERQKIENTKKRQKDREKMQETMMEEMQKRGIMRNARKITFSGVGASLYQYGMDEKEVEKGTDIYEVKNRADYRNDVREKAEAIQRKIANYRENVRNKVGLIQQEISKEKEALEEEISETEEDAEKHKAETKEEGVRDLGRSVESYRSIVVDLYLRGLVDIERLPCDSIDACFEKAKTDREIEMCEDLENREDCARMQVN